MESTRMIPHWISDETPNFRDQFNQNAIKNGHNIIDEIIIRFWK